VRTFLIQVSYKPEAWAAQIASQANVLDRATPSAVTLGGRIIGLWYALGEYDLIGIVEFPTPEAAAAWSTLITSGGAVAKWVTTQLLTVEEGITALTLADGALGSYVSPVPGPG
jgi:uncharacterized protein with GYD domain